jgi:hypothetical protein
MTIMAAIGGFPGERRADPGWSGDTREAARQRVTARAAELVCGWCGESENDCAAVQGGNSITWPLVTRQEFEENGPRYE